MPTRDTFLAPSRDARLRRAMLASGFLAVLATAGYGQTIRFGGVQPIQGVPHGYDYTIELYDVAQGDEVQYEVYVNGVLGPGWPQNCVPPCYQTVRSGAVFELEPGLMVSAVAELVDTAGGKLVDRVKTSFVKPRIVYTRPGNPTFDMGMQITQTGVDELAGVLRDILLPDDFGDLVLAASDTSRVLTGDPDPLACVDLSDLDPSFVTIPGVQGAFNVATSLAAGVYTALQNAIAASGPAAVIPFCVRQQFTHLQRHWEVCVGRLDGELVGVDVDGLEDLTLLPYDGETPGGPLVDGLALYADLGDIELTVDVTLADLFFRWKHAPGRCTLRPQRDINSTDPAFEAWSSCPGLGLDLASPGAEVDSYDLDFVRSSDLEGTAVDGGEVVDVELTGTVDTSTHVGQCGLGAFNPVVEELVEDYLDGLAEAIGVAWLDGAEPVAQLATNDVLLPLAVGTLDAALDVELHWAAETAEVDSYTDPFRRDGFIVPYGPTIALLRPEHAVGSSGSAWAAIPEDEINYSNDGLTGGAPPYRVFDIGYTISTNNLNQILYARAATHLLNFTIEVPAVTTATSGGTSVPAAMNQTLELRVFPSQQPFTWMIPDPEGIIPGVSPVVYHLMRWVASLVGPSADAASDETLATMEIDFLAPSVKFHYGPAGSDFLDFSLGTTHVDLKILTSEMSDCPREVHDLQHASTCEGFVELFLRALIEPVLLDSMQELLSEVPGPNLFDAAGIAPDPCTAVSLSDFQDGQRIMLYGDLDCGD